MSQQQFTCLSCRVAFDSSDHQREHYRTDWHKYNLKRKVLNMPAVTAENFQERIVSQQEKVQAAEKASQYNGKCKACNKSYSSENAYKAHLESKKHRENEAKYVEVEVTKVDKASEQPAEDKADDGDEMDEDVEEVDEFELGPDDCLFCTHTSKSLEENIEHMTKKHSFFIPDYEYLVDLEGFIKYLGLKIAQGHMCLFCNEKGKTFHSMDAVQKHMIEKGHTILAYDDLNMYEYSDYYDYSSSYPDYDPNNPEQAELDATRGTQVRLADDASLVLPNGKALGHRDLKRYYDQNLRPENGQLVSVKPNHKMFHKAIGYGSAVQRPITTREKYDELHKVARHSHWWMNVGCKANKLQRHYRPQVNF